MKAWQDEWPREVGLWWFYGHRFKPLEEDEKKELCLVEVCESAISSQFIYTTMGHWLYKEEGARGKWQKAVLPELPKEDECPS